MEEKREPPGVRKTRGVGPNRGGRRRRRRRSPSGRDRRGVRDLEPPARKERDVSGAYLGDLRVRQRHGDTDAVHEERVQSLRARLARMTRGEKQALSRASGVSASTIRRIETGEVKRPALITLLRLSKVLNWKGENWCGDFGGEPGGDD